MTIFGHCHNELNNKVEITISSYCEVLMFFSFVFSKMFHAVETDYSIGLMNVMFQQINQISLHFLKTVYQYYLFTFTSIFVLHKAG